MIHDEIISRILIAFERKILKYITIFRKGLNKYAFWIKKKNYCIFCQKHSRINTPYGTPSVVTSKMIRKGVATSGFRLNSRCPVCGSYDRERFLYYVLEKYTNIFCTHNSILHIAPEFLIRDKFKSLNNSHYITGDICPGKADYIVDLTKTNFHDGQFDYIICSHVLQDIIDEKSAISEMKRIVKATGFIILAIPVCSSLISTFENHIHNSPFQRLRYYGNRTHVRIYGNDILNRLGNYNLNINEIKASNILTQCDISYNRFISDDCIYICKINGSSV